MSDLKSGQNKRILFVSHNLELEGASWSLFFLAKEFRKNYKVEVLSPRDGPLRNFYEKEKIDVKIINYSGMDLSSKSIRFDKVDVFFVNTIIGFQFIGNLGSYMEKVVWCIRESEREVYFNQYPGLKRDYFKNVAKVIFVSDTTRKIYEDINNNNFVTIHNGLDFEAINKFIASNSKKELRRKYDFLDNDIIVNITGTVCLRKGQLEFAEAAADVVNEMKNNRLKFLIIGGGRGGSYERRIKDLIEKNNLEKNIFIVNETPSAFDYYLMSDIFVCNSYIESFPRVVLEAMAFGLPIISTNVYGISEQITDGEDGILIMAGDTKELSRKIKLLIENNELSDKLSRNAKTKVKKNFSLENMTGKYSDLFKELLNK